MGTPQVTPLFENRHAGGFMVWDQSDGALTRAELMLANGAGKCLAGLVLGKITVGAGAFAALGTNTGNPTCGAITVAGPAMAGEYDIHMQDPTHYVVLGPPTGDGEAGEEIGHGVFGAAFAAGGLGFTITAGGIACVAGDSFKVTVAAGSGQYVPYNPTLGNGAEVAAAILWATKDATSAAKRATAVVRGPCKVQAAELVWDASVTTTLQQTAALAQLQALGILNV